MRTVKDLTKQGGVLTDLRIDNKRFKSFMHSIPYHYCGWSSFGTQVISPGFENDFLKAEITCFDDLKDAFSDIDALSFSNAFRKLSQTGETFDLLVNEKNGERIFKVVGISSDFGRGEVFSILWFEDHTNLVNELSQAKEDVHYYKKSREFYEMCFSKLPFPVWFRNDEGHVTWCNNEYAKVLEVDRKRVLDEKIDLIAVDEAKLLAEKARKLLKPQSQQAHIVVDGKRCLFEINEVPLVPPTQTLGFVRDVTDLESASDELARMKTANTDVLEQVNLPVAIYAPDMSLSFYNSSYARVWGVQDSWLNKKPLIGEFLDHLRQKRKLPEQANFRDYVDMWRGFFTNLIDPYEEMMYLPDGKALRTVAVPHPQGGLMITHEDVTSRLELEASYNTLIAVQRETIDHLAEGVCVFGPDGRMRLYNKACKKIWGLADDLMVKKPHITELVDSLKHYFEGQDWSYVRESMVSSCLAGKAQGGRFTRSNGSILDYRLIPLPDGSLLASYLDVTDSVHVEEALIEKNTALEAADQLKSGFLANVSYQLRNPLNAIIGFADILDQQYFGEINQKQQEYVHDIVTAGKDLVALIDDILDLSTIEAGYLDLDLEEVQVADLLDSIREIASDWGGNQQATVLIEYPDDIGSFVLDLKRMKQVLLNLIQNAVNFNKGTGGHVLVKASRCDGYLEFRVEDDGIGIAPKDLENIFKPFLRAQETKEKRGLGIGLSLVKSIVELHCGDVLIESQEGKGTQVIVKLPYSP